jgi:hypothetical protein
MYVPAALVSAFQSNTQPAGPNLIQNEPLVGTPAGLENWSVGGVGTEVQADVTEPGAVIVRGGRDSTFFQDIGLRQEAHHIVFGAWVKSKDPRVAVGLTGKQTGAEAIGTSLVHPSGSGKWEWLQVSLDSGPSIWEARPHLFVFDSVGEILGPVLAIGNRVEPRRRPKEVSATELGAVTTQTEKPDFSQFRVNFPQTRLGFPSEPFSNVPLLYGYRCYGGDDSVMDPELERFFTAFVPDPTLVQTFGVRNAITEPRILDLLGVRYDLSSDRVRPNALPRISVFSGFEVSPGFDAQLARLKDPSFDYTRTVVLDSIPSGAIASGAMDRFIQVPYVQVSNSRVHVRASVSRPSVLLFNDSFSPDWRAYRNGEHIPLLRANAHFMAVSLPAGASEIDFRFEPARFYLLVKISLATALLLLLAGVWRLTRGTVRKYLSYLTSK